MRRELTLTGDKIDEPALVARRFISPATGAVASFFGIVRAQEERQPIAALHYEAFEPMALHQLDLLFDQIEKRWPVESVRLVHRTGRVEAGEASLWVEVTAPHRQEAFAACQFLIDGLKKVVPIWKRPLEQ